MPKYYVAVRGIELKDGQLVHFHLKAYESQPAALARINDEESNIANIMPAELCRVSGELVETFGGLRVGGVLSAIGIKRFHHSVIEVEASDLDLEVPAPKLLLT